MISVIATVLNEGDNIATWLDSFLRQTRIPDEIIIVDGGSTDNTAQIIRRYAEKLPIKLIIKDGCNISEGRNIAIHHASYDVIAITDAGTRLTDTWVEKITQPLLDDSSLGVSCGFFKADPHTTFEAAMGATVLPLLDEVDPDTFLPSSRSVAVRQSTALEVNGYPEWLDYCEDLIFDLRLKETAKFTFVPDALVYFRPRGNFETFFKQYYRYARGDGKADLWRKRHLIRYITYLVVAPILLLLAIIVHPLFWLLILVGGGVYMAQPYRRLPSVMRNAPDQSALAWVEAIILVPVVRIVGDIAKMIGYPVGWRWRLQNNPPEWRITPEN